MSKSALFSLNDRLDGIRAQLDDIAKEIEQGDVCDLLIDAKDLIASAQDLMESEWV